MMSHPISFLLAREGGLTGHAPIPTQVTLVKRDVMPLEGVCRRGSAVSTSPEPAFAGWW